MLQIFRTFNILLLCLKSQNIPRQSKTHDSSAQVCESERELCKLVSKLAGLLKSVTVNLNSE